MKILHTADWHLGHRLHEQSQFEEQMLFLEWLESIVKEEKVDVLLISGDIFDTGTPSAQSSKMYYDVLANLTSTSCQHIVVTGGNHDAPGMLNAPKDLFNALSIKVVGKATENPSQEVLKLDVDQEAVIVAAVPYLRDQDIRRAVEGETFNEITARYKQALVNHYQQVALTCEQISNANTPIIAMGHLFAIGGTISDSEQSIYVGNLGHIGANDFPEIFDYIALGHLHRPQMVDGKAHIRYSGSPNILSFSEVGYEKKVLLLETQQGKINRLEEVSVPRFREVIRIQGSLEDCIAKLKTVQGNDYGLTPWVEVTLDNNQNNTLGFDEIHQATENLDLKVLKVTLKRQRHTLSLEQQVQDIKEVKELSPEEVFKMKCKEQGFVIEEHPDIFDAFHEALQIARKA